MSRVGSAVRLGSFFPLLPWEPGVGWDTDPPTTSLAEASSSPAADFAVRVEVPAGLAAVATGVPSGHREWRAAAVRDFALAVGRFREASVLARAPRRVRVTVGVASGMALRPHAIAVAVRNDLQALSRRFGPYPWPALHVAVLPGQRAVGIEYPTMIFLGDGTAGVLITHEVAHQWFYGLVGNDQARDPVLDEGPGHVRDGPALRGRRRAAPARAPHRRADDVLGPVAVLPVPARGVRRRCPRDPLARPTAAGRLRTSRLRGPKRLRHRHPGRPGAFAGCGHPVGPAVLRRFGLPATHE